MNIDELKQLRERRGYSIRKLSELSGVPFSLISAIERGKVTSPRVETVEKLLKVFGKHLEIREQLKKVFEL